MSLHCMGIIYVEEKILAFCLTNNNLIMIAVK